MKYDKIKATLKKEIIASIDMSRDSDDEEIKELIDDKRTNRRKI